MEWFALCSLLKMKNNKNMLLDVLSHLYMCISQLLERIGPATEELKSKGIDFSLWYKPEDYRTDF
jgi:hypothetical protein